MKNIEGFLESAQKGIVTVEFRKIDTDELRIMPCTLNSEVANTKIDIKGIDPKSDHIPVWALDKKAWRAFRVSTVERWYDATGFGSES